MTACEVMKPRLYYRIFTEINQLESLKWVEFSVKLRLLAEVTLG